MSDPRRHERIRVGPSHLTGDIEASLKKGLGTLKILIRKPMLAKSTFRFASRAAFLATRGAVLSCLVAAFACGVPVIGGAEDKDAAKSSETSPGQASGGDQANKSEDAPDPSTSSGDALVFRNGDILFGELKAVEPADGITWLRENVQKAMRFDTKQIAEIRFDNAQAPPPQEGWRCRAELANGDHFQGKLLELQGGELTLDMNYAGKVSLPREAVRRIELLPPREMIVYEGPRGVKDWTIGKVVIDGEERGRWHYRNGAFYASEAASIAREMHLPDRCRIEMDLRWQGVINLAVALYTDYWQPISLSNKNEEPPFGGFYSLQINNFSALLMSVRQDFPLRRLDVARVPTLNRNNEIHVEILVDKSRAMITLLVDGEKVKTWRDERGFIGEGSGVRFVHQGRGKIKLSNLTIRKWDGTRAKPFPDSVSNDKDVIRLRDGELAIGTIERIREGKVSFQSSNGGRAFDLEAIQAIRLARGDSTASLSSGDKPVVTAHFHDGARATFHLTGWDQKRGVQARSPLWGEVNFQPEAVRKLRFAAPKD